jgi:hypothetical protein
MSLVSGRRLGVVAAIYTYTAVVVDRFCKLLVVGCRLELLGLCCLVLSAVVVSCRFLVVGCKFVDCRCLLLLNFYYTVVGPRDLPYNSIAPNRTEPI